MKGIILRWVLGLPALAGGVAAAWAQSGVQTLKVQLRNGGSQYFRLSEKPVVTFDGAKCLIASASLSAEYLMADIECAVIVEQSSGVTELERKVVVDYTDAGNLVLRGLNMGSAVRLADVAGRVLRVVVADSDGCASIDLSSAPKGVYIVSSKEITFKVYRK